MRAMVFSTSRDRAMLRHQMGGILTEAERVWNRLKTVATEIAQHHGTIGELEARALVDRIIWDEGAREVHREARCFFVSELMEMVSMRIAAYSDKIATGV